MLIRHPEADARMARSRGLLDYWPHLATYALTSYCLPVIVMLALFITLAMGQSVSLPGGAAMPTSGLPLMAISAIWVVFYGLRIIDHTTRGYATPPPMGSEALYLAGAIKPLSLPLMIALAYFALAPAHPALARSLLAFALFVMPAYLFILATESALASALNPLRWFKLMLAMGLAYLLPGLLLMGGAMLLGEVSGRISFALLVAAHCYLLFGTAHLLGYLGFKQQHQLGLQVDVRDPDEEARDQAHRSQLQELLRRIHEFAMAGHEARAIKAVESHGGGPKDSLLFYEQLFRELLMQGSPAIIHAAGRRLITLLLAARQPVRALEIAEACLHSHWHFSPATSTQLEALLRQAISLRFEDLYERLLKGAEADQHGAEPMWAGVQFLRAQHQSEVRRDDAGALQLLQPLRAMTRHPQHSVFDRTARTLEALLARRSP